MTNPTAQVPMSFGSYNEGSDARYWPLNPTNMADTYYAGEMIGFNPATGYAGHLDDTQVWLYLGNKIGDTHRLQSDTPTYDFKELVRWTRFVDMPVASGTPALPTNFGDPAYVADSGHVQLNTSGLTNNNLAGMVVDIGRSASAGPGTTGVISLSANGSPLAVRVASLQPGALLGLLVAGVPGPGTGGAAAKALSITGGAGAASTALTGTTAGGAGSPFIVTLGAGGAASSSGGAAGGAGGAFTLTGGAGGNAAGTSAAGAGGGFTLAAGNGGNCTAGTGNGGAGGSLVLNAGTGGTSSGGAAGAGGNVKLANNIAPPAGGSAAAAVLLSSTAGLGVYFGSGAPTVSAAQGSLYLRTDGSSTSTRMYVNTNGGTTWTNVTTAA